MTTTIDGLELLKKYYDDQDCSGLTPEPLMRQIPKPRPFPVRALGSKLAGIVNGLISVIQAPDSVCAQSVLAVTSLATQAFRNVEIDGRTFPLSVNFISVAESGERKSAVDKIAMRSIRTKESQLVEEYTVSKGWYDYEIKAYHSLMEKIAKDRVKGVDIADELPRKPEEPLLPFLVVEEPTYEGLVKILYKGQPSIGIFSDEGGRLIGGHSMNDENALKSASGLSELWDGKSISRIRAGEDPIYIEGKRVSMHLMVQPIVFHKVATNSIFTKQGFFARCLVSWPESKAGTRSYVESDVVNLPELMEFHRRVAELVELPKPLSADSKNQLRPISLPLSLEAKARWIKFYEAVEGEIGGEGRFSRIKAFANKAPEQCLRLAGILSVFDNHKCDEIDLAHLERAIELTEYYLSEAVRLFDYSMTNADLITAQDLLDWIRLRGLKEVYPVLIYQSGPGPIRQKDRALKFIRILEDHRWLLRIEGGGVVDGIKRKELWAVNSSDQ